MNRTTRLASRTVKTVMSLFAMGIKMLHVHFMSTTAALTRSMLFASFTVRWRVAASVHVRWFSVLVNMAFLDLAALGVMRTVLGRVHRMLLYHVMNMVTFVVSVMTVVFTMHFVMFSHNLPLMLV
jgi:hypothetical protein